MTINDLKKMKREALIEHAVSLARENESLAGQVEKLQAQLKEARDKLKSRTIAIGNAGSIAEASLQLNGVFEAAQKAADEYLAESKRRADAMLAEAQQKLDASGAAQALDRADAAASEAPEAAQRGLFGRGRRQ